MISLDRIFFILCTVLLLSGCASEYPRLSVVEPLPAKMTCKVTLLPFAYQGEVPQGENIFYKAFATDLKNIGGFEVNREADVQHLYQQLKLYRRTLPNESQMQIIGKRLNSQLLVVGEIIEMNELDTGSYVDTNITVSVRIHEVATGKMLWSTYHKRKGEEYRNIMHYGRVNTITGLSRRVASEIITMWAEEGFNQCNIH